MSMKRNEILDKLKEILLSADAGTGAVIDSVTEDTHLLNDLGLSSVNMLYLMIATEEVFQIRFDDVGVGEFPTVGDVVSSTEGQRA